MRAPYNEQVIGRDPQRGQLRSWSFDDEGGHGEALWSRDGHAWVLDAIGVQPDGTPTAATNILTRVNDDQFTWRSVERMVAGGKSIEVARVKITEAVRRAISDGGPLTVKSS